MVDYNSFSGMVVDTATDYKKKLGEELVQSIVNDIDSSS
jgi:hypothetical protein